MTRWAAAVVVLAGGVLAPADVAFADPAGPTDYETTITSIEPAVAGVEVSVVGGDAFLRVDVEPGIEVVVLGYQQEPYLRIRTDGVVEENQRSPATYLNADRYGGGTAPAGADPTLEPNWRQVGTGGTWSWHDHRAHWMSPEPPPDAEPGAEIQTSTVPLVVNGVPVTVGVSTTWLPEPSGVPLAAGAAAGLALVVVALVRRARPAWALLVVALAAVGIGIWQYRSLPPETGPLLVWWLLPAVAAGSLLVALLLGRRLVSYALVLLAALELAAWVWVRRDAAFRAVIPTDAPYWLDRGVMAATGTVAAVVAIGAAVAMFRVPNDASAVSPTSRSSRR
jgi:hypothetical protein